MKKLILLPIIVLMFTSMTIAQEVPPKLVTIDHDWGSFSERKNGAVIDVREALTDEKQGLSTFFTQDYAKATKAATKSAKKLLSIIYNVAGVADMRFSTYQIQIIIAPMFSVTEIEPAIFEAMDSWYQTVTKEVTK